MRAAFQILFIAASTWLYADDVALRDGSILQHVVIISADRERMLIVHDGGGCQVEYGKLAKNTLSPNLRNVLKAKLEESEARRERLEKRKLERQAFEQSQLEKGFVQFEGAWVKPMERENILAARKQRELELESMRLDLEKKRAELRKEERLAREGDRLLEQPRATYLTISTIRNRRIWYGNPYPVSCDRSYKSRSYPSFIHVSSHR